MKFKFGIGIFFYVGFHQITRKPERSLVHFQNSGLLKFVMLNISKTADFTVNFL